jgi:hypothetical protein
MDLIDFHERIYGKFQNQLFVFEPTWDSFRPIVCVGWDGKQFSIQDVKYKQNLFSPHYGYESDDQKKLCKKLTEETELGNAKFIVDPLYFWKWCSEKNVKWWKDRPCVFYDQCVSTDNLSWKSYLKYLEVRPKTLKNTHHLRLTRRLVKRH